jgi:hypothetical protein
VQADSVLVGSNDPDILTDFGGGATGNWIDKEFNAGDLQGLERMMDSIFNDQSSPRPANYTEGRAIPANSVRQYGSIS